MSPLVGEAFLPHSPAQFSLVASSPDQTRPALARSAAWRPHTSSSASHPPTSSLEHLCSKYSSSSIAAADTSTLPSSPLCDRQPLRTQRTASLGGQDATHQTVTLRAANPQLPPPPSAKPRCDDDAMAVQQHVLNWLYSVLTSVWIDSPALALAATPISLHLCPRTDTDPSPRNTTTSTAPTTTSRTSSQTIPHSRRAPTPTPLTMASRPSSSTSRAPSPSSSAAPPTASPLPSGSLTPTLASLPSSTSPPTTP